MPIPKNIHAAAAAAASPSRSLLSFRKPHATSQKHFRTTSRYTEAVLRTAATIFLNPDEYLCEILAKLPHMTNRTAKDYTPGGWKAARENQ